MKAHDAGVSQPFGARDPNPLGAKAGLTLDASGLAQQVDQFEIDALGILVLGIVGE
jgi:hypothetical protein